MLPPSLPSGPKILCPADTHVARCVEVIYTGTIPGEYKGEAKNTPTLRITWETPNELHTFKEENGPEPFLVSQKYGFFLGSQAKLRQAIDSWRGVPLKDEEAKVFDISKMLGAPCMVTVVHKTSAAGKERAEVGAVTKLLKGMEVPAQINKSLLFDVREYLNGESSHVAAFDRLPSFIQEEVRSSLEYKAARPDNAATANAVVPPPTNKATQAFEQAAKAPHPTSIPSVAGPFDGEDDLPF